MQMARERYMRLGRFALTLTAENDYDPNGLALRDELPDCLSAYIAGGFDGDLKVKSIDEVTDHV